MAGWPLVKFDYCFVARISIVYPKMETIWLKHLGIDETTDSSCWLDKSWCIWNMSINGLPPYYHVKGQCVCVLQGKLHWFVGYMYGFQQPGWKFTHQFSLRLISCFVVDPELTALQRLQWPRKLLCIKEIHGISWLVSWHDLIENTRKAGNLMAELPHGKC